MGFLMGFAWVFGFMMLAFPVSNQVERPRKKHIFFDGVATAFHSFSCHGWNSEGAPLMTDGVVIPYDSLVEGGRGK